MHSKTPVNPKPEASSPAQSQAQGQAPIPAQTPDQTPAPAPARPGSPRPAVTTTDFSRRPFGRCGLLPPTTDNTLSRTG
ncbi:MAG: hypothetical protein AAF297_01055 [Planctomycetota bacterium]